MVNFIRRLFFGTSVGTDYGNNFAAAADASYKDD